MELRDLLTQTLHLSSATMFSALFGFFFWSISARWYEPAEVGRVSSMVAALNLIFFASTLGLNVGLLRFHDSFGERATGTLSSVMIVTAGFLSAMYLLINPLGLNTEELCALILIALFGTAYNILAYIEIVVSTRAYLLQSLASGVRVAFPPVLSGMGSLGLATAYLTGFIAGSAYGVLRVGRLARPRLDGEFLRAALGVSMGNYLVGLTSLLPVYLVPTLVVSLLGSKAGAYYYIAFILINLLLVPPGALGVLLVREHEEVTMGKLLLLGFAYWLLLLPVILSSKLWVPLLFGAKYVESARLLLISAPGLLFGTVNQLLTASMTILRRAREIAVFSAAGALVLLLSLYPLMEREGLRGTVSAWILSSGVVFTLMAMKHPKTF
ncbi:lipopolysaccharide biosynthesis protein [Thermococcus sp.]